MRRRIFFMLFLIIVVLFSFFTQKPNSRESSDYLQTENTQAIEYDGIEAISTAFVNTEEPSTTCFNTEVPSDTNFETEEINLSAIYLGVDDFGEISLIDESGDYVSNSFRYRFYVDNQVLHYNISNIDGNYSIQNLLKEGYRYTLNIKDGVIKNVVQENPSLTGTITAVTNDSIIVDGDRVSLAFDTEAISIALNAGGAEVHQTVLSPGNTVKIYMGNPTRIDVCSISKPYQSPISNVPGQRTLKNLLATAMQPVGTSLYVYGGAWNWQNDGASLQATTIGIPQSWIDFFQNQTTQYHYKSENKKESYYPFGTFNQYHYAGADCSGYIGWTIYNVLNTESGHNGYVYNSTSMAKKLSSVHGLGTWTQNIGSSSDFKPGDIMSINGHVWLCVGVCNDGSIVILHSTPSNSKTGNPGGGIQLSGLGDADCEAIQLAKHYMDTYYPEWADRYTAVYMSIESYVTFKGDIAGRFRWNLNGSGLTDPDAYSNMSAHEILADLFGENG